MPTETDRSALTADEVERLGKLVREVVEPSEPGQALGTALDALDQAQQPALAAALHEAVCYRVPVDEYWLHFRMAKVYRALGHARDDATFFHAAAVVRLHPDWSGADQAFRDLFLIAARRGHDRAALDLFRHQMRFQPELPAASAHELAPILRRLGEPSALPAPTRRASAFRLHVVVPEQERPPSVCAVIGGVTPASLRPLAQPMQRPPISVAEFHDAEVLLYRNAVVVVDAAGDVAEDFCVGAYPEAIRARMEQASERPSLRAVDEAVVIADHFAAPNICHFLYDQITRLALYRALDVGSGALVIGPQDALPAQQAILRRAGVTAYLPTDQIARVRVRRLWVASTCRALRHPSHLGADWALSFIHRILGGRGEKGWRRLYLSREDARVRRVVNGAEVAALLAEHGFEPFEPGRLPYEAQISAFRQASHIVAPHGAGLTHLVLCPPGARVLEIFHPLYGTAAYAMQAAAIGLDYTAMVARDGGSDAPCWNDPDLAGAEPGGLGERDIHVPLDALRAYLAGVM